MTQRQSLTQENSSLRCRKKDLFQWVIYFPTDFRILGCLWAEAKITNENKAFYHVTDLNTLSAWRPDSKVRWAGLRPERSSIRVEVRKFYLVLLLLYAKMALNLCSLWLGKCRKHHYDLKWYCLGVEKAAKDPTQSTVNAYLMFID